MYRRIFLNNCKFKEFSIKCLRVSAVFRKMKILDINQFHMMDYSMLRQNSYRQVEDMRSSLMLSLF